MAIKMTLNYDDPCVIKIVDENKNVHWTFSYSNISPASKTIATGKAVSWIEGFNYANIKSV